MEEAFGQAVFYDLATGNVSFSQLSGGLDATEPTLSFDVGPLFRLFLLADDQKAHRHLMKQCQQWASRPYYQSKADWDGCEGTARHEGGLLTRMLVPALANCSVAVARADAQRSLLRFALATYRFQAGHGSLPGKPDELVPEFLSAVPQDPFDGKPLRMKKTERGLVLYSLGPDMADNGGAKFDSATKAGDLTFAVEGKGPLTPSTRD